MGNWMDQEAKRTSAKLAAVNAEAKQLAQQPPRVHARPPAPKAASPFPGWTTDAVFGEIERIYRKLKTKRKADQAATLARRRPVARAHASPPPTVVHVAPAPVVVAGPKRCRIRHRIERNEQGLIIGSEEVREYE